MKNLLRLLESLAGITLQDIAQIAVVQQLILAEHVEALEGLLKTLFNGFQVVLIHRGLSLKMLRQVVEQLF